METKLSAQYFASVYGVSPVNICRWRTAGKLGGQEPPLDDPRKMADWWQAMVAAGQFKKGVPTSIQVAADRAEALTGGRDADSLEGPDGEADLTGASQGSFSYELTVEMAETNLRALKVLHEHAIAKNNIKELGKLQRSLKEAMDAYRALSKDRSRIAADAGEFLPKSEIRAAMLEIHGNIVRRFRRRFKDLHGELLEHAADPVAWQMRVDGVVDEICLALQTTGFAAE